MADGQPLILGQTNQSESATVLEGGNGGIVARNLVATEQGQFGPGSANPNVIACVINGTALLNGLVKVGNADTENRALEIQGATKIDGSFAIANAGVVTIPAGEAGRSFPIPKWVNDSVMLFVVPRRSYNGTLAARVENGQGIVELSHRTSTILEVSWVVVGSI